MRPLRGARRAGLAVLLLAAGAGCETAPPTRQQVLERILPSSVQIVIEQREGRRVRSGSGVAIAARRNGGAPECIVLTAGHTLSGLVDRVSIFTLFGRQNGTGTKVPATIVTHADNAELDVAVLSAATDCSPAVATGPPVLGDSVWVVAFPWGGYMTLATGVVSQIRLKNAPAGEPPSRFMIDALVGYGASGSGVYQASTGRLLGIVEGYGTARVAGQGATPGWYIDIPMPGQTFVTPLSDVQRYLRKAGHGDLLAIASE